MKLRLNVLTASLLFASTMPLHANQIELQNATATFSQSGDHSISRSIDGVINQTGWAIFPQIQSQIAVFETKNNVGFANGSELVITLTQAFGSSFTIGSFRLALTTDNRSNFADGLSSLGDVTATWQNIMPLTVASANGSSFTQDTSGKILALGNNPASDVYTISTITTTTGITGLRLEVFTDPSLPANGPGRSSSGNFVLSEFSASISPVPEASTMVMLLVGISALTILTGRRSHPKKK